MLAGHAVASDHRSVLKPSAAFGDEGCRQNAHHSWLIRKGESSVCDFLLPKLWSENGNPGERSR